MISYVETSRTSDSFVTTTLGQSRQGGTEQQERSSVVFGRQTFRDYSWNRIEGVNYPVRVLTVR
jgi:hypothetical protein